MLLLEDINRDGYQSVGGGLSRWASREVQCAIDGLFYCVSGSYYWSRERTHDQYINISEINISDVSFGLIFHKNILNSFGEIYYRHYQLVVYYKEKEVTRCGGYNSNPSYYDWEYINWALRKMVIWELTGILDRYKEIAAEIKAKRLGYHIENERVKPETKIYFIGNKDYGLVKIGITENINGRLSALQVGCPFPLEVFYMEDGDRRKEIRLHKKYSKYSTNQGEWFYLDNEIERRFLEQ